MGVRVKISLVFLLFLALFLVSATVSIALGTERDPEIDVCKHQCEQLRGVGEREKEACKQRCERYKEEKERRERQRREEEEGGGRRRGRGHGGDSGENPRGDPEEEEEEGSRRAGSNNPYVFEDQHFMTKFRTEHGRVRILQKFTDRSELFRGIENFRLGILEADPQTFIVPKHCDADALVFVANGRGTVSLVFPEKRESFNIRRGDILRIPAGITAYLINRDNTKKLVLANLIRPISTPGEFESFSGPGGESPETSFYSAFSTEILEAAFNTRRDRLEGLFGRQKQGMIIKASEEQIRALSGHEQGTIWPFGGESKGALNLFEKRPAFQNEFGRFHEVDPSEHRDLRDLNIAVSFANITQGSMLGPYYNSKSTHIAVVLNGEGYFEMACPHLSEESHGGGGFQHHGGRRGGSRQPFRGGGSPTYQKVRSRLKRGVVYIIPAGHPVVTVASSGQNLEVMCFEVNADQNHKFPLAGRRNVVSQFEREAQELAFGAPAAAVEEVFESQEEEFFFRGPKQQGRAVA